MLDILGAVFGGVMGLGLQTGVCGVFGHLRVGICVFNSILAGKGIFVLSGVWFVQQITWSIARKGVWLSK